MILTSCIAYTCKLLDNENKFMTVGVAAIDRVQMSEVFSDTNFNECWTCRRDKELMVIDNDSSHKSEFSNEDSDRNRALTICNEDHTIIVLLSIDNALVSGRHGGIADCALFDEAKFRLVEFKTNALGNSEQSIRDTFDKALSQLKETLTFFSEKYNDQEIKFDKVFHITCHVVTSNSFPKSKAVKQEYQLSFAEDTGFELGFSDKIYW